MGDLEIAEAIERLRQNLERLATHKDLLDPEVIRLSQELDKLIVKYYQLEKGLSDN